MRIVSLTLALLLLTALPDGLWAASPSSGPPVRIFFDTDMHTDCDDAGALAVLHALADKGECEILATVVSVKDYLSAATVDAINTYHGRPGLPLGMVKGAGVLRQSGFTSRIAADFPHRVKSAEDVPDATEVYREVLAQQPDGSVVIVTVGYLTNLRNLLRLPATDGHPSGRDLITRKVVKWICMGGNFVGHPPKDDLKLGNVNFQQDADATRETIPHWPGPIVFVGREIGSVPSGLQVGANLAKTPPKNPVRMAYYHYFGGQQKSRHVADLTTVLYAVRGLRDYWDVSAPGRMQLQPDVKFEWQFAADGNQSFLLKKLRDGKSNDRYIESVIDELLLQPPHHRAAASDSIPASQSAPRAAAPVAPPYPPSPIIAAMDWAPTNRIIRTARDGDNWPLTWADDDALYTTWGDYSHDDPRADTPADRFILMRAPKDQLTAREAWEFFVRLDAAGQPVWTPDIRGRGAVFRHPGACLRSAMTYCAPLKRYLWWQQLPQPAGASDRGDTRFTGGFAVYDAPEPWGPWTTAFFTEQWDVGPGEHGDFPAKWMSNDGRTLHLVFSGDDSFSMRSATVTLVKTISMPHLPQPGP